MRFKSLLLIIFLMFLFKNNQQSLQVNTLNAPVVYLTFDDGPNEYTDEILNILDVYDIKASFFVTGAKADYYSKIKKAYDIGHTIGLHCFSHDYKTIYSSKNSYLEDLEKIDKIVSQQTGMKSHFIRFPGGSSNLVSKIDMQILIDEITKKGYKYFDWNQESGDAKSWYTLTSVMNSSLEGVDGNRDIMLLCHEKAIMVETLPTIIEYYLELGYIFLPITENTSGFHHKIN